MIKRIKKRAGEVQPREKSKRIICVRCQNCAICGNQRIKKANFCFKCGFSFTELENAESEIQILSGDDYSRWHRCENCDRSFNPRMDDQDLSVMPSREVVFQLMKASRGTIENDDVLMRCIVLLNLVPEEYKDGALDLIFKLVAQTLATSVSAIASELFYYEELQKIFEEWEEFDDYVLGVETDYFLSGKYYEWENFIANRIGKNSEETQTNIAEPKEKPEAYWAKYNQFILDSTHGKKEPSYSQLIKAFNETDKWAIECLKKTDISFKKKCQILAQFWAEKKHQVFFAPFELPIQKHRGLPLASLYARGWISKPSTKGIELIEEEWSALLETVEFTKILQYTQAINFDFLKMPKTE